MIDDLESVNSQAYWQQRFLENWEACQGPNQSRFFARLARENLPQWLFEQIQRDALTFVDWGCAQGDGTDVFASYIDAAQITGVDFSSVSIAQAQVRYPAIRFLAEDWLQKDTEIKVFDVVFSSNTLEHFHQPYQVLEVLCQRASKAVILALPFQEKDRISEHFFTFLPENIPLAVANRFRLVWSSVLDCSQLQDAYWGGDQIFLAYVDSQWMDSLNLKLCHSQITPKDITTEIKKLNIVLGERDHTAQSLRQVIVEKEADVSQLNSSIAYRDGQIWSLTQSVLEREGRIESLEQSVSERGVQIEGLTQSIAERERQIEGLEQSIAERGSQIEGLTQSVAERESQIQALKQSMIIKYEEQMQILSTKNNDNHALVLQIEELKDVALSHERNIANKIEQMRKDYFALSDWADRMNSNPLKYAFKKYVLQLMRGFLSFLPISMVAKQQLRSSVLSLIKPFRLSSTHSNANYELYTNHVAPLVMDGSLIVSKERDILIFSVIDWHFRIQRPQHLARSFAKAGKRVFFLSNHFVDSTEAGYQIERLDASLDLYQIKLHIQGAPAIYFAPPTSKAEDMLKASITKLMLDFGIMSSIAIVQHAYWFSLVKQLPNTYRVYDCMDHHEGFGNVPETLINIEKDMLSTSDLVVVTSTWLENIAHKYNKNVVTVRNAGEYHHFASQPTSIYMDTQQRKIIGYYGAIAEWFDLELIRAVATHNPNCLILLVGNDTVGAKEILHDVSNIIFTGEVPYIELPFYLYAFDVCLLPFKVIPLTLATNPVKVYEYLAAGKPVVSVSLPEITQFGDMVLQSNDISGFLQNINTVLNSSSSLQLEEYNQRKSFAKQQTWDHRVFELQAALKALYFPLVSVIVLTYNNLELTQACLKSLILSTDYPNLEIIVVDNASTDDTAQYLKEFEHQNVNVRVILNDSNLGFAAGNNIGLAAAKGDYLVILNNDTVVTKGWVLTLLRHLQIDSTIGLIGPITNNIGNEARVEMKYLNIMDMPSEANCITLKNMGKTYPIRNLAFFCVMFPRLTYERCGAISEDYGLGFFEDDDYCRKVEQAGMRIVCADDVFIHHHLSASFNKLKSVDREKLVTRNREIYERKWGKWIPHKYR